MRITSACLALALAATSPALADDIFVSSPFGSIFQANTTEGRFEFAGVCGGPIRSMFQHEQTIMIGDANGNMYGLDLGTGGVGYYFTIPGSNNTGIVADGSTLLVSSLNGTVRRVNAANGQLIATYTAPIEIRDMTSDDQFVYAAGPQGNVYRAPLATGEFSYFACACLGPINSLAIVGERVIAGDEFGTVMLFDRTSGLITDAFALPGDNTGMTATPDDHLFVTDSDGQVRLVNPVDGAILSTFVAPVEVNAIVIVSGDEPLPPCTADFNGNGTVDSADFFDFLSAFFAPTLGSKPSMSADFNDDGMVNSADFFAFLTAFLTPCA